jgi:serine protease Do
MMRAVLLILVICIYANVSYGAGLPDVVNKVIPSVCKVLGYKDKDSKPDSEKQPPSNNPLDEYLKKPTQEKLNDNPVAGFGSCFVIKFKDNLYLITNNHVIDKAETIKIQFYRTMKHYDATVIGADKLSDIAILTMSTTDGQRRVLGITPLPLGNSSDLVGGQTVFAIGHPLGQDWSISKGIVSYAGRRSQNTWQEVVQTDVSINQGNSGGPLFNMAGEVIGVNTYILAPGPAGSIGVNFSVTSNIAKWVVEQLIVNNEVKRGMLGLSFMINVDAGELYIKSITGGGGAEQAGLMANDVLLNINGREISLIDDVGKALDFVSPGDIIAVTYRRGDEVKLTNVTTTLLKMMKTNKD